MTDFPEFDNENMGGNESFEYSPKQNISAIADPTDCIISSAVTFVSPYDFYTGKAVMKSLSFSEDEVPGSGGELYKRSIKGYYPTQTAAVLNLFKTMAKHHHVVKITDFNGAVRLVGNLVAPLKFKFKQATGDAPASKNGYSFEFYLTSKYPSPYYTA